MEVERAGFVQMRKRHGFCLLFLLLEWVETVDGNGGKESWMRNIGCWVRKVRSLADVVRNEGCCAT